MKTRQISKAVKFLKIYERITIRAQDRGQSEEGDFFQSGAGEGSFETIYWRNNCDTMRRFHPWFLCDHHDEQRLSHPLKWGASLVVHWAKALWFYNISTSIWCIFFCMLWFTLYIKLVYNPIKTCVLVVQQWKSCSLKISNFQ